MEGTDFKITQELYAFITPVERYNVTFPPTMLGASSHTMLGASSHTRSAIRNL